MVFLSPTIKLLFAGASVLLSGCTHLLFQPVKQQLFDPETFNIQVEEHFITSGTDIKLHGWRLPSKTDTRGTLVFLHGNAENISSHVGSVYWLPEHGYEVFLFDYRGFGKSTDTTEISGMIRDTENMIVYASRHAGSPDHIVTVLGHRRGRGRRKGCGWHCRRRRDRRRRCGGHRSRRDDRHRRRHDGRRGRRRCRPGRCGRGCDCGTLSQGDEHGLAAHSSRERENEQAEQECAFHRYLLSGYLYCQSRLHPRQISGR